MDPLRKEFIIITVPMETGAIEFTKLENHYTTLDFYHEFQDVTIMRGNVDYVVIASNYTPIYTVEDS